MYCKLSLLVLLAVVAASQGFSKKLAGRALSNYGSIFNSTSYVYDGTKTTIQKHPYLVSFLYQGQYIGPATIVSSSWVVFAADLSSAEPSEVTLVAGSSDGLTGKKYSLKKIVVHPKYDSDTFDYDYALGQIKGKFKWSKKTKPIKLATKQPKANTAMVTASWGDTSTNSGLMQGTMKWLSTKSCTSIFKSYQLTFTSRMGCVYNKGKTTLCYGDGGAPFVSKNMFYGYFIATDMSVACTSSAIPDLLANIPTVAPWIKKITGAKTEDDEDEDEE